MNKHVNVWVKSDVTLHSNSDPNSRETVKLNIRPTLWPLHMGLEWFMIENNRHLKLFGINT